MTAQGTQMLLPDGLSASAAADALAGEVAIVTARAHTIERTFWDTFDGRVHDAGLALIGTRGRLALADATTYAEQAGDAVDRAAERLFAGDIPAGPLRERLASLLEMRAALPTARVRSRLLPINVLDEEGKTVKKEGDEVDELKRDEGVVLVESRAAHLAETPDGEPASAGGSSTSDNDNLVPLKVKTKAKKLSKRDRDVE